MISNILAISFTGFRELVRSRLFINILVAGVGLVLGAMLLDQLAAEVGARMVVDLGLAFLALLMAVLAGTTMITNLTRDIETKQVHLVLARPVSRSEIVIGRFFTVVYLILVATVILGAMIALLSKVLYGDAPFNVFIAALFGAQEAMIVAALACVFGVVSSSTMSAVFVTTLFILGRLTGELNALIEAGKLTGAVKSVAEGAYWVLPRLSAFDLSNFANGETSLDFAHAAQTSAYAFFYIVALLAFACFRFQRRDIF